jgi:hypothetical protein
VQEAMHSANLILSCKGKTVGKFSVTLFFVFAICFMLLTIVL